MAKAKKKRNKVYRGADSKLVSPQVIKVEAVDRNKPRQWWHEKKRIAKPIIIASLIALIVVWLLWELLRAVLL